MGRPPSAGLVRSKNDSMARAGPWWPMAALDLRVGLAGKPPPALYCPSVDRLGIEATSLRHPEIGLPVEIT